jgi:glycosyltransferase involved in cell wall biosynthesis
VQPVSDGVAGPGAERPVRVEAVVSGRLAPSSRFRVFQHVAPLRAFGVEVTARPPRVSKYALVPAAWRRSEVTARLGRTALPAAKLAARLPAVARSWRNDVTWLEREMLPGHLTLEPYLHRPLLFDIDDAIWLLSPGHERAVRATAGRASCVIAGNDFLADYMSAHTGRVDLIPTAVDTERFSPKERSGRGFVVGWTGSATTYGYLEAIAPALGRFLDTVADAKLVVMANHFRALPGVATERVEFVEWSPANEASVVAGFDVGLMPLPNSDWARGKCAFKMLQYLACGVPAVVSPVGMNAQVLAMGDVGLAASSEDEWVEALLTLARDPGRAIALGRGGRDLVATAFSVPVITRQLAGVMTTYR